MHLARRGLASSSTEHEYSCQREGSLAADGGFASSCSAQVNLCSRVTILVSYHAHTGPSARRDDRRAVFSAADSTHHGTRITRVPE
jgi:hypothetical protein